MDMIVWLEALRVTDEPAVGTKAANLGDLMAAGFRVPPAFVITTDAWRTAREHQVPDELLGLLTTAYAKLGRRSREREPRVAVRASVDGHGGGNPSSAGVYESVTNVRGVTGIADAVSRCWASLVSDRAVAYRALRDLPPPSAMAAIVQTMVPAVKGGLAFSTDPTGREPAIVAIEAAYGLPGAVTNGLVEPDRYLVGRRTEHVVRIKLGTKAMEITPARTGEVTTSVPADLRHARTLSSTEASDIAWMTMAVEAHMGGPQEVEWCYDARGTLYLLQARSLAIVEDPASRTVHPGAILTAGAPASPGVASGPARVLAQIGEVSLLRDGEVLVVTTPGPEWVPGLERVAAVVADRGGVTTHLASVCRELGIPCVVGTRTATAAIRTGDHVIVHGDDGTVRSASIGSVTPVGSGTSR